MTPKEIKIYLENYIIDNGKVYLKEDNKQITDEDTILKVKSARLIYNEARASYQSDIKQFNIPNGDFQKYITKTMEKLSVNNEINTYGINKLINSLLTSNGHYEENMSGNDLVNSKFSILVGVKQEYALAYLKLKFREKGLDIDNFTIKQDLSELKHNGISKVIIDFKLKKYEKKENISDKYKEVKNKAKAFSHPKADLLNELEKQKKDALAHNDQVTYNFAQSNIERIIRENPVEVSPEQWDLMGHEERKSFILIKMKEAKVLNDEVNFNFWNANLKQLEQNKQEAPNKNDAQQTMIETTTSLYEKMINALKKSRSNNFTEEEKKQIVGEIYYYEGFLVNSLHSEEEIRQIMTKAMQDFSNTQFEQYILNSLVSELQERLKIITPKGEINTNNSDLSVSINNIKKGINKLSIEYKQMLSDGKIDDQELDYLIKEVQKLYITATALKANNLSPSEYQKVNEIIAIISKEEIKMLSLRENIEKSIQNFQR